MQAPAITPEEAYAATIDPLCPWLLNCSWGLFFFYSRL